MAQAILGHQTPELVGLGGALRHEFSSDAVGRLEILMLFTYGLTNCGGINLTV